MREYSSFRRCPPYEALSYLWGDERNKGRVNLQLVTLYECSGAERGTDLSDATTLTQRYPSGHHRGASRRTPSYTTTAAQSTSCGPSYASSERAGSIQEYYSDVYAGITMKCEVALRSLRRCHSPRTVWVDSICINQSDPIEKSRQLEIMGHIYHYASQVVAHVGAGNLQRAKSSWDCALFHRTWVIQEILHARKVVLSCGTSEVPFDDCPTQVDSAGFPGFVERTLPELKCWYSKQPQPETPRLGSASQCKEGPLPSVGKLSYSYLPQLLYATRKFECQNRRDKLFALLSLFSGPIPSQLRPDYTRSVSDIDNRISALLSERERPAGIQLSAASAGAARVHSSMSRAEAPRTQQSTSRMEAARTQQSTSRAGATRPSSSTYKANPDQTLCEKANEAVATLIRLGYSRETAIDLVKQRFRQLRPNATPRIIATQRDASVNDSDDDSDGDEDDDSDDDSDE